MNPVSGEERPSQVGRTRLKYDKKRWASNRRAGWKSPPPLDASGRPADLPAGGQNIAFRFGVEQADKLRACDDLNHILTNAACRVRPPIKLVSWGHASQLCRTFACDGGEWDLFKADHEAAYKQLPLDP